MPNGKTIQTAPDELPVDFKFEAPDELPSDFSFEEPGKAPKKKTEFYEPPVKFPEPVPSPFKKRAVTAEELELESILKKAKEAKEIEAPPSEPRYIPTTKELGEIKKRLQLPTKPSIPTIPTPEELESKSLLNKTRDEASDFYKKGDYQSAVNILNQSLSNPQLQQDDKPALLNQRANIFFELAQKTPENLAQTYIDIIRGGEDNREIDTKFFNLKSPQRKSIRLSEKATQDRNEAKDIFIRSKAQKDIRFAGALKEAERTGRPLGEILGISEKPLEPFFFGLGYVGEFLAEGIFGVGEGLKRTKEGFELMAIDMMPKPIQNILQQNPEYKPLLEEYPDNRYLRGAVKALAGTGEAAFAAVMHFTPQGAAFTAATKLAEATIPGADTFFKYLFAPVSSMAELELEKVARQTGVDAEELKQQVLSGTMADILSVGDLAAIIVGGKMAHKYGKEGANKIKEKIQKGYELTPEEINDIGKSIVDITKDKTELKKAVEDAGLKLKDEAKVDADLTRQFIPVNPIEKTIFQKQNGQPTRNLIIENNFSKDEFHNGVDEAKYKGGLGNEQADALKTEYDNIEGVKKKIPEEHRNNVEIVGLIEKKNELLKQREETDKSFHPEIDGKIKEIDERIVKTIKPAIPTEVKLGAETAKGFIEAGAKSKETKEPSHLAKWIIENSKVGDVIQFSDSGYEIIEKAKYKKGIMVEIHPYEIQSDGSKLYGRPMFISEWNLKGAEGLFETSYRNEKGERVVEQGRYIPATPPAPAFAPPTELADIAKKEAEGKELLPEEVKLQETYPDEYKVEVERIKARLPKEEIIPEVPKEEVPAEVPAPPPLPIEISGLKVIEKAEPLPDGTEVFKVEGDRFLTREGKEVMPEPEIITEKPKSILTQETDLKGEKKEVWMFTQKEFPQAYFEKQKLIREATYIDKEMAKSEIKEMEKNKSKYFSDYADLYNVVYKPKLLSYINGALREGRMTASDAKTIIESAKIEVPKDILEMAEKEKVPTEIPPEKPLEFEKVLKELLNKIKEDRESGKIKGKYSDEPNFQILKKGDLLAEKNIIFQIVSVEKGEPELPPAQWGYKLKNIETGKIEDYDLIYMERFQRRIKDDVIPKDILEMAEREKAELPIEEVKPILAPPELKVLTNKPDYYLEGTSEKDKDLANEIISKYTKNVNNLQATSEGYKGINIEVKKEFKTKGEKWVIAANKPDGTFYLEYKIAPEIPKVEKIIPKVVPAKVDFVEPDFPRTNESYTENEAFKEVKNKYESAQKEYGRTTTEPIASGDLVKGRYTLIDADNVTATHNEKTFGKSKGVPVNERGETINDRNYEKDKSAQASVVQHSEKYDRRAVKDVPMVTKDGIIFSGNDRTMARKLSAKKGTDADYLEGLKEKADMYGIDPAKIDNFKKPFLVFELETTPEYSTKEYHKYNIPEKKEPSTLEEAVTLSKILSQETKNKISNLLTQSEGITDLQTQKKLLNKLRDVLLEEKIITQESLPKYFDTEGKLTETGKDLLENIILGSIFNEAELRTLSEPGMKRLRNKLTKITPELAENSRYEEFSILTELKDAVELKRQQNASGLSLEKFVIQRGFVIGENNNLTERIINPETLNFLLDIEEKGYADLKKTFLEINREAKNYDRNKIDLFGKTLSPKEIVNKILKSKYEKLSEENRKLTMAARTMAGQPPKTPTELPRIEPYAEKPEAELPAEGVVGKPEAPAEVKPKTPEESIAELQEKLARKEITLAEFNKQVEPFREQLKEKPAEAPAEVEKGIPEAPSEDINYQQAQEINTIIAKKHPAASVLILPKGEDLSLNALFVKESEREKGLGSAVLKTVKEEADRVGKKVSLIATTEFDTKTDLVRLGKFYERNGFTKVGENKYEYTPPKAKPPSVKSALEELKAATENARQTRASLGIDPFEQAKRQAEADKRVFDAYVDLAKEYIKLGIKTIEDFAKELGEEINDVIRKAWESARAEEWKDKPEEVIKEAKEQQGQPTISNTPPIPPPSTIAPTPPAPITPAGKWFDAWHKAIKERAKKQRIGIWTYLDRQLFNQHAVATNLLDKAGANTVIAMKNITKGAGHWAKDLSKKYEKDIYGKLSEAETETLDNIIAARRTIELDTMKDNLKKERSALITELNKIGITEVRENAIKKRIKEIDELGYERLKHTVIDGVPLTKELAQKMLDELKASDKPLYDKINARADKYFTAMREVLKERLDEKIITQEEYDRLTAMDYSKRRFVERMIDWESMKESGDYTPGEIMKLKEGSEDLLFDNTRYLLQQNIASTARLVFQNRANKALWDWAKENEDKLIGKKKALSQVKEMFEVDNPIGVTKEGAPKWRDLPTGKHAIWHKFEGKDRRIIVDGDIYRAWIGGEPYIKANAANIIQWVMMVKPLKYFATGINAAWALKNIPRDLWHVSFFTDAYGISPVISLVKIPIDIVKNSRKYKIAYSDYVKHGGGFDTMAMQAGRIFTSETYRNKLSEGAKAFESAAQFINNWSEQIVRISVYERMIEKRTKDFQEKNKRKPNTEEEKHIKFLSANDARSYMDFSAKGRFSDAVNNFVAYFTAGMAAIRSAGRYVRKNPGKFAYKITEFGAITSGVMLYNMSYDEDDEKEGILGRKAIPPYVSATNLIFMLPWTKINEKGQRYRPYLKLPVTQDITVFKAFFDSITEWGKTGEFHGAPIGSALKVLTPVSEGVPTPPIFEALLGYYANYDFFRDTKFWKGREVRPTDEYTYQTPKMFVDIAQGLDKATGGTIKMSPERMKGAYGKIFTDHRSNIYSVLLHNSYDAITSGLRKEEKYEIDKATAEKFEEFYRPFQKAYYGIPSVRGSEEQLLEEKRLEENSRIKREEKDKVKFFIKEYKEAKTEEEKEKIRFDVVKYADEIDKKAAGAYERITNSFDKLIDISDVTNTILVSVMYEGNPEVKARVFYELWRDATEEKRKSLMDDIIILNIVSERFLSEFDRLEKAEKLETKE